MSKQTQTTRILALLQSKPEVSAFDLGAVSLQYCARVAELRDAGYVISNRVEMQKSGVRHGFYKLISRPPILVARAAEPQRKPLNTASGSLFPDGELRKVEFEYPD